MIYVSSSCVKAKRISESVFVLAKKGFKNIELSGGTKPYKELTKDLFDLKKKFDLNYICHNYFPPPQTQFVLNLASLNDEIYDLSYNHLKNAIELSNILGATKFGFHAGFLINLTMDQIGRSIEKQTLFDRKKSVEKFKNACIDLMEFSDTMNIQLYIENNVLSSSNFKNFEMVNPFLFTDYKSLDEVRVDRIKPLVDYAHLKVSSNVLGLDFKKELSELLALTDYIHLSDNNGKADQNKGIQKDSDILSYITPSELRYKVITLEIYDSLDVIIESYNNLQEYLK